MRVLETLLLSVLAVFALSLFIKMEKRSTWLHLLPGLSLCIALMHTLLEGQRWQMLPVYLYTVLLFTLTLKNIPPIRDLRGKSQRADRRLLRLFTGALNVSFLLAASMPPFLVPVFKLPIPTGPYDVGIRYLYFIDESRPELLTPDSTDFQEVSVQVWYPAQVSSTDRPVRYWENASQKSAVVSEFWGGLPSFLFSHFSLVRTHSFLNAALSMAQETYPVLIFNHGSIGLPSLSTVLMEALASSGFVVFSVGHSDYIPFFIKPDGTIRAFDPNAEDLQMKMRENDDPGVRRIARRLMQSQDLAEQEALLREFLEKNPHNQESLFRWAEDIRFTMNELERLNQEGGFFSGRIDLDRIGVFGVSFGGAASTQACSQDKRCKAAVSMDCPQFGDFLDRDVTQPIMFMSSEQYKGKNDIFLELKDNPQHLVMITGTTHQNLSDLSIWGQLFKWQMLGSIDGERCLEIQNAYITAFFDKYLRHVESELLKRPSPTFPEVEIKVSNLQY